jgi:Tol biopolymer transport system component
VIRRTVLSLLTVVALACPASTALAQGQTTLLVSRANGMEGEPSNAMPFPGPAISGDGRYVAFLSPATNLGHTPATPLELALYVRDVEGGTTTPMASLPGGPPRSVSFSADGRYMAYEASQDPFQVFVLDRLRNETSLVSRASGEDGGMANGAAGQPSISANGRYVAFASFASNLSRGYPGQSRPDGKPQSGIYVRDLVADVTTLASRASGERGALPNLRSLEPSISASGRYVAFESEARLGVRGLPETFRSGVFVRDLAHDKTKMVGRWGGDDQIIGRSASPSISASGRYVAFSGIPPLPSPAAIEQAREEGRRVPAGYVGGIVIRDLVTARSTLVSRASGRRGHLAQQATEPSISANGRYVAFQSRASRLTPDADPRHSSSVFLRDTRTNRTVLVRAGGEHPQISADGSRVAYDTAGNWEEAGRGQVFLYIHAFGR